MKFIFKKFEMPFRNDEATTKQDIHNAFRSYLVMEHRQGKVGGFSIPVPTNDEMVGSALEEGERIPMRKRLFIAVVKSNDRG